MRELTKRVGGGAADVDDYLAAVPEPGRTTLRKVRAAIRKAAPAEATEAIGYRMPTFRTRVPGWWATRRSPIIAVCFR